MHLAQTSFPRSRVKVREVDSHVLEESMDLLVVVVQEVKKMRKASQVPRLKNALETLVGASARMD